MESRAIALFQRLQRQHNMAEWTFKLDKATTRAGCCKYGKKIISLAKIFVHHPETTYKQVSDTIYHEFAHALCPKQHHNKIWINKCIELGGNGKRCHTMTHWIQRKKKGTKIIKNKYKKSYSLELKINLALLLLLIIALNIVQIYLNLN